MAAVAPYTYVKQKLARHFPEQDFPIVRAKGKHAAFHYQLQLLQPDQQILKWLAICTEKYTRYINLADSTAQVYFVNEGRQEVAATGLPPLSMAILMGRRAIVEAFCASPLINMEVADRAGWIPLQHAIARNDPEILRVVEEATDKQQQTAGKVAVLAKDRFPFLRKLLQRPELPAEAVVVRYKDGTGSMNEMKQKKFMEFSGGAQFYDGLVGTPDSIFRNWYRNSLINDPILPSMLQRFDAYCRKPPKLFLAQDEGAGLGVRAQEKIEAGDLVAFCGSELMPPEEENSLSDPHSNIVSVGKRLRNWGMEFNDGFPNTQEFPIVNDGVEFSGLIALRQIDPGERVLHSYDFSHQIKWGPRVELALPELMEAFPGPTSPAQTWKGVSKMDAGSKDSRVQFDYQCKKAGLVYLFHTPSVLLSLLLRVHFDLDSVERLLKDPKFLSAMDLDKGRGTALQKFYAKTFVHVRAFQSKGAAEAAGHIAAKMEKNLRAGVIALQWVLDHKPGDLRTEFDRIYDATAAFFAAIESKVDMPPIKIVSRKELEEIIARSKSGTFFVYTDSKDKIAEILRQLEELKE